MNDSSIRWLDRLAHDLRGPLTPLQTAAFLLRSGQVQGDRQQELFGVIERQTQQLTRMIDELADWTRMEHNRLLGTLEPCEPALLVDYARGGSAVANAAIVDDESGTAMVECDPVRMTQLLRTLIEYASARGKSAATVALRCEGDRVRIDVRDAGSSPSPEQLALLLEQPQAEPYDEGLGLRLLVARGIAEAHGGTLSALSENEHLLLRCELPRLAQAT
ncbi:sensor histidine kinase [Cognatiluteimonas profundi]|uniref:sensor histidine kinase n=1 Tax=Cognatiluteimonas profundi TaxID=2594501 RepID=UPI00131D91DE|nr:histidine kinase dimerization/phospho-acceptor domain-containing protein [Lysobacter profundi]